MKYRLQVGKNKVADFYEVGEIDQRIASIGVIVGLKANPDTLTLLWSGNTSTLGNITLNSSCTGLYDAILVQSGAGPTVMSYLAEYAFAKFILVGVSNSLIYYTFTGAGRLLGVDDSGLYLTLDTTGGQPLRSIYGIIRGTRA